MAHYIDADRLKAEIERRRLSNRYIDTEGYESELLDIITSLQQEQKPTAEGVLIRAGLKPFKDGNQWCILAGDNIQEGVCGFGDTIEDALYEFLIEVLSLQKEQKPAEWSEDLDAEVKRFFDECVVVHAAKIYGGDTVKVIAVSNYELTARHFAEWGAAHARKEDK